MEKPTNKNDWFAKKATMLPKFRASYVSLLKKKMFRGKETKYGLQLLIPKTKGLAAGKADPILAKIKKAVWWAKLEKYTKEDKFPAETGKFIFDGDSKKFADRKECKGHWVINVAANKIPEILDREKNDIPHEQVEGELYSGCYCDGRIVASLYNAEGDDTYNEDEPLGVSLTILSIRKLSDGPKLGGGTSKGLYEDVADEDGDSEDGEAADNSDEDSDDDGRGF